MNIPPDWMKRTLADLLRDAHTEPTGIAFDALREPGSKVRSVIIICVSLQELIDRVEEEFSLVDDGLTEPWSTFTMGEALRRTLVVGTMTFERFKSPNGRSSALVLIAADPLSIRRIEALFRLES